jgi:hypothetical protein
MGPIFEGFRRKIAYMYMQDNNARGIIYMIGLAVAAVVVVWKLIIR